MLTALVVDDNAINRTVLTQLLKQRQIPSVAAENGRDAVRAAEATPFDVILMDLQMPILDGFRATEEIRAHQYTTGKRCPIIAVTASFDSVTQQLALDAGIDSVTVKPIRGEILFGAIAEGLLKYHPAESCAAMFPELSNEILYHQALGRALNRVGDDHDLLRDLLNSFVELHEEWQTSATEALKENDLRSVEQGARELVSSARNLIITPTMLAATNLSRPRETQTDPTRAEKICETVGQEVELLVKFANCFLNKKSARASQE